MRVIVSHPCQFQKMEYLAFIEKKGRLTSLKIYLTNKCSLPVKALADLGVIRHGGNYDQNRTSEYHGTMY